MNQPIDYELRIPEEPEPFPIQKPPDPPENPNLPVREPDREIPAKFDVRRKRAATSAISGWDGEVWLRHAMNRRVTRQLLRRVQRNFVTHARRIEHRPRPNLLPSDRW